MRHPLFTMFVLSDMSKGRSFGISIGRAVGPAVRRNRTKRRLREIYRRHRERLAPRAAVMVAVRPRAAAVRFKELEAAFLELSRRAGILVK